MSKKRLKESWLKKKLKKTRNVLLFFSVCCVIIYTIISIVITALNFINGMQIQLDSVLTTEVFSYFKWVVIGSGVITCAKTLKGDE